MLDKECSNEIIDSLLKPDIKFSVLDTRKYTIYINPIFIVTYICLLIKYLNLKEKITRQLFHIYYLNIVRIINPKIIITYIDNNSIYLWLSQKHKDCEFIAIQNGLRQKFENYDYNKICKHQHFYCFGEYDVKKHESLGCRIKHSYPVGSYRVGLYQKKKLLIDKEYDLCIISSDGRRNPDIIQEKGIQNIAINNRKIDQLIYKYINENNLRLVIALSTGSVDEKNYYREIFGGAVKLIDRSNEYSTYNTVSMSNISVSFMSTMILETIALGNKAISIHFEDTDLYFDYPKEVKYLYHDYNSFKNHMDKLLKMTDQEYLEYIKASKDLIMNNNIDHPPHLMIKKHLNNIINNT